MYKIAEDELVVCPYNRYHVISKLRLQRHIIKCKKNYPNVHLLPCFYNYSHRLKPEEILEHYETCPQKIRIEERHYLSEFHKPLSTSQSCESLTSQSIYNQTRRTYNLNEFDEFNEEPNSFDASSESSDYVHEIGGTRKKDELQYSEEELEQHSLYQESCKQHTKLSDNNCSDSDDYVSDGNDSFSDDEGENEDEYLKPLSLPKTISQAFALAQNDHMLSSVRQKGFGRGLSLVCAAKVRSDEKLNLEKLSISCEQKAEPTNSTDDEDFEEYESVHFSSSCSDISIL